VFTKAGVIDDLQKDGIFDVSDCEHAESHDRPDYDYDFAGARRVGDLPSDITGQLLKA
jgi:hypothetical protein